MKIVAKENGPYIIEVEGEVLIDGERKEVKVIALCRCGHSQNKPFCDGSHAKKNFQAKETVLEIKRG